MKIKWIAPALLGLCVASSGALKAAAHEAQPISGTALYQDHDHDRWDEPPSEYRDAQRQGYHEGIEAARKDFAEHRHADADDHRMYKNPPVEGDAKREFREGFREGYRRAMDHMAHDHDEMPHN